MKRRSGDNLNQIALLTRRIEPFLDGSSYIDLDDIVVELQKRHKEYARWKQQTFRNLVARAYENLAHTQTPQAKKKSKRLEEDQEQYSSCVSYPDQNLMNSSMLNLYKKSNPLEPTSAESSFFIDKTGSSLPNEPEIEILPSSTKRKPSKQKPSLPSDPFSSVLSHPSLTFSDIGGCSSSLLQICRLLTHIKHPSLYSSLGIPPPRGFLLHGPPGSGKNHLVNCLSGEFSLPLISVVATELIAGVSGESEKRLRDLFSKAVSSAPCLLFIDEIDSITPKRENAQREMERRIVAQLLASLDDLSASEDPSARQVLVIGATSRPDALDPGLRRAGRFDKEIALGIPDEPSREKILLVLSRKLALQEDVLMEELAHLTPGFVPADLASLVQEGAMCSIDRVLSSEHSSSETVEDELRKAVEWLKSSDEESSKFSGIKISREDFLQALKKVQPSAKREGFLTVPDVRWSDVGALESIRRELEWSVLKPIRERARFESFGLSNRAQGILLCGPPGCGKTLLAKAIANETGMNFISVKGPELLSMYVGESEKAVRQVFQRASNSAPCVIFFDELDALCPRRAQHDSGGTVRVVNQLLTEMDGIDSLRARKEVFVIGATNRPDIIDPAILRPGRLDKVLFVGFPSSDDRGKILLALSKQGSKPCFGEDVRVEELCRQGEMEWFSGADLAALLREASVEALKEEEMEGRVWRRHFERALKRVRPSVDAKERGVYEALRIKYEVKSGLCE